MGGGRVGVYSRGGVEGDAFADPPAPAAVAHRVGSKRRKGIAPAKSRAGGAAGGANLPPELRGVDLDNLLDGIEY